MSPRPPASAGILGSAHSLWVLWGGYSSGLRTRTILVPSPPFSHGLVGLGHVGALPLTSGRGAARWLVSGAVGQR